MEMCCASDRGFSRICPLLVTIMVSNERTRAGSGIDLIVFSRARE